MDISFLGIGYLPKWTLDDIQWMPKGRYKIMVNMQEGRPRRCADAATCTVQVNLNYSSENAWCVYFALRSRFNHWRPLLCGPNSTFHAKGEKNGYLSYRSHIWSDTDPDRTGMLPFVFEDGFGFKKYVDYILDMPMYFVYRDGTYIDASGQSFRDFMKGGVLSSPQAKNQLKDWEDHMTTAFPEVRLKQYLEMRGADGGP